MIDLTTDDVITTVAPAFATRVPLVLQQALNSPAGRGGSIAELNPGGVGSAATGRPVRISTLKEVRDKLRFAGFQ